MAIPPLDPSAHPYLSFLALLLMAAIDEIIIHPMLGKLICMILRGKWRHPFRRYLLRWKKNLCTLDEDREDRMREGVFTNNAIEAYYINLRSSEIERIRMTPHPVIKTLL
ncbi:MAG: hypothetical protein V9822_01675 [Candidatus Dasytiphilus stammeri]